MKDMNVMLYSLSYYLQGVVCFMGAVALDNAEIGYQTDNPKLLISNLFVAGIQAWAFVRMANFRTRFKEGNKRG